MAGTSARAAPDGYEITTWAPRSAFDRFVVRLEAFSLRHRTALLYGFLVLLTLGFMAPILPYLFVGFVPLLMVATVAPMVIIMLLLWRSDRTSREPLGLVMQVFLVSIIAVGVAGAINTFAGSIVPDPWKNYLVVAPVEEFTKILAVLLVAYRHKAFDHPIDGLFYGIAAGAGFSAIENVHYVVNNTLAGGYAAGLDQVWTRLFSGHMIYAGISGYYIGLAKFNPEHRNALMIKGFLIAILVHGSYNTLAGTAGWWVANIVAKGSGIAFLVWKVRRYYAYHGLVNARPLQVQVPIAVAAPGAAPCASCGAAMGPGARFCGSCGSTVAPAPGCATCGNALSAGARFCMACGKAAAAR